MKVVATLTTIPGRIDKIQPCLKSLLDQTYKLEHIEINIPTKCTRTGEEYVIPEWLKEMKDVHIYITDDLGPITKVAPTFLRITDSCIWSVDDDWIYPKDTLERLVKEYDGKRILGFAGVYYNESLKLKAKNGGFCNIDILEGWTSILYPPNVIKDDFKDYLTTVLVSFDCALSDDLILANYFAKHGIVRFLIGDAPLFTSGSHLEYQSDSYALHKQGSHAERYVDVMKWLKSKGEYYLPYKLDKLKIGLCMIVKNESHIIKDALQSTLALIDTFMILDTGSTDNTVEIITNFYAENKVEGAVVCSDWKGFGPSRSQSLKLCDGKMDYILVIDADDLLIYPDNFKESLLNILLEHKPNSCNVNLKRGNIDYVRTQIFKANDDWRYEGVLHEYPTNDKKDNKIINLPKEVYMVARTLGNRSNDRDKYLRDAETLLAEVEKDPTNSRNVFYLAQSYRDAGRPDDAVKWYKKRYELGGWPEEVCVSALNISKILNDKEWAWKAHEANPKRIESLVAYGSYCRSKNLFSRELLSMLIYASNIPKPSENVLFVERDCYDWRVFDELSIVAYYTGDKELSKNMCIKLLHENKFPEDQKKRIETNLKVSL